MFHSSEKYLKARSLYGKWNPMGNIRPNYSPSPGTKAVSGLTGATLSSNSKCATATSSRNFCWEGAKYWPLLWQSCDAFRANPSVSSATCEHFSVPLFAVERSQKKFPAFITLLLLGLRLERPVKSWFEWLNPVVSVPWNWNRKEVDEMSREECETWTHKIGKGEKFL